MGTKITTLKAKTSGDDVYPNILAQNIPSSAVNNTKIADNAISKSKMQNDSVGTNQIEDGAITNSKIGVNAVTAYSINDGAVDNDQLHVNAVSAAKMKLYEENILGALTDYDIPYGTLADFAAALKNIMTLGNPFWAIRFWYRGSGTNEVYPVTFEVDGSNMVTWRRSDDYSQANDLTSDADVLSFIAGDGARINVLFLE